jgi:hypothetical protein
VNKREPGRPNHHGNPEPEDGGETSSQLRHSRGTGERGATEAGDNARGWESDWDDISIMMMIMIMITIDNDNDGDDE